MKRRRKLLIFADWFAPGLRGGGIIRSTVNIARLLKDEFEVFVFTRAEDFGMDTVYRGIKTDRWQFFEEKINVYYCTKGKLSFTTVKNILLEVQPESVYLNNIFSYYFTWIPVWLNNRGDYQARIVLATRGLLEKEALQKSKWKKKLFLSIAKKTRFFRNITFQAVAPDGVEVIKTHFSESDIKFVPNFPSFSGNGKIGIQKKANSLKALFVGRVSPEKNILWLLKRMRDVDFQLTFNIAGGIEDAHYWQKCLQAAAALPENVTVNYLGEFQMDKVFDLYRETHILIHPTKSEGFGHVIIEALSTGRPVLVSDGIPWKNLTERKAGWNFSLDSREEILHLLRQIANMDDSAFAEWSAGAFALSKNFFAKYDFLNSYIDLFE